MTLFNNVACERGLQELLGPDSLGDQFIELTVLMPCLDEAETVASCVAKAQSFLQRSGVAGEVLVADNGSTDGSQQLAVEAGARVVHVAERGYGAALIAGIREARGRYVIMGDADHSYDFSDLEGMLNLLQQGNQLVMGDRFAGGIQRGAMPLLHRYLGNPVLSFLGRLFFRLPVRDFHCGLRGFDRDAALSLNLESAGMEFASELVVKAGLRNFRIAQTPVVLSPDGRSRPPHLRTWRDGWRHLRFLLLFSPRWLFLLPGVIFCLLGLAGLLSISMGVPRLAGLGLDIHTMAYSGAALILGVQMLLFAVLSKVIAIDSGWLPPDRRIAWILKAFTLERGVLCAFGCFLLGISFAVRAIEMWEQAGFGGLDPSAVMRWVIPSVTLLGIAGTVFLAAFFLEALRMSFARSKRT
ncbi:glycosyltransferase family 2 protein [Niveibacterium sp. SC-1]|uniref:glycosyltransferase family 2 protein n=1 Tax=Niveibacterium sp. SC-1 TaxID=3135646 RepID=UPI00311FEAFE